MSLALLIVEDDEGLRPALKTSFRRRGYEVFTAASVAEAGEVLHRKAIAVVLLDIQLPDGSGLDVLTEALELDENTVVVMMTAYPEIQTAIRAMRGGASDFVIKPFDLQELHLAVERAVEIRSLRQRVRRHERERSSRDDISEIIGESAAIEHLREQIRKVGATDAPVLIIGATGTGKELVADAVHRTSERSNAALIKVNCSAFSEALLESELFGHEKGAFTDAKQAREGVFEMAAGGTLFLDEIAEMDVALQTKLLRVVEGHAFRRIGGKREIQMNARIVAASNQDLPSRIQSGQFREDLYFRLNVFQITVPPLRDRGQDVIKLARFFLRRSAGTLRKAPLRLTGAAEEVLQAYGWPGNVRELRNIIERAAILTETDTVDVAQLPGELRAHAFVDGEVSGDPEDLPGLADIERRYIEYVVDSLDGNLSQAARALGIARNTLKSKLRDTGAHHLED